MGSRMDVWVLMVSIAIPFLCVAALVLRHLIARLLGKLPRKRTPARQALEPGPPLNVTKRLPSEQAQPGNVLPDLADDAPLTEQFLKFLERCEALAASFPDLPEAAEAKQRATRIKLDLQRLQRASVVLAGSLAERHSEPAEKAP